MAVVASGQGYHAMPYYILVLLPADAHPPKPNQWRNHKLYIVLLLIIVVVSWAGVKGVVRRCKVIRWGSPAECHVSCPCDVQVDRRQGENYH